MEKAKKVQVGAWSLSMLVALLAFAKWAGDLDWKIFNVSTYQLFPLFGLLAFSVMWSHYVAGVVRRALKVKKEALKTYFSASAWFVLVCILLHPGLLTYQLWRDGFGLPPGSVTRGYVGKGLGWVVLLGEVSLLIFLAYEFHRKFSGRTWWHWVQRASDVAMLLIFYHALRLGNNLQHGWFRYLWFFYGTTLIGCYIYNFANRSKHT